MPTLDYTVGASSDDAHEFGGTVTINSATLGTIDATTEYAGLRWTGVTIPDGATIDVAYIRLSVPNASFDEPLITIRFENTDSPATFSATNNNINTRTMTTASVLWDNADLGASGSEQYFNSPSIVSLIGPQLCVGAGDGLPS
jgi:glycine betaine/choline ABC-type transport system substrate-binding protein